MKKCLLFIAAVLVVSLTGFPAFAAEADYGKFSIFAGPEYFWAGDIDTPDSSLDMDSKVGFNVGVAYRPSEWGVELSWSRYSFDEGDLDPQPYGDVPGDLALDMDMDFVCLGVVYSTGDKYKFNIGAGPYLAFVDMDASGPGWSESDDDTAFGAYIKAGVTVPIVSLVNLDANLGYRFGGDATVFDDVDVETNGAFANILLRLEF